MKNFTLEKSIEILERTPRVLFEMLNGISADWTSVNEGGETWSAYDVIGHLIHGEKTDWMVRIELILSTSENKHFVPFDRFAQFQNSKGKSMEELLEEFRALRTENLGKLKTLGLTSNDLSKKGIHPTFGEVTLLQLISAWVVHDLDHISQISRVMAKQYTNEVGPWIDFLKVLRVT